MRIGLRGVGTVDRLITSDPGLVQLRVASGKVLSLGMSLAVLYGFTKLAGQPYTAYAAVKKTACMEHLGG